MTCGNCRIVILGGSGMLGTDVTSTCREKNLDVESLDLPGFDITNPKQLEEAVNGKDIIINCAAYTNVDGAESQRELAYRINTEAVGKFGELARKSGAWLLHVSTDFVFDGKLEWPYKETDTTEPLNEYGRSKLEGERLLARSGCDFCILRVQWTYGSAGNNFVSKLINKARAGHSLKVVSDQVGSPTATTEVAKVICTLIGSKPQGIFHFAAGGYASRFDVAKFIIEKLSLEVELSACNSSNYKTPAERPLNSRFNCSKIQALLGEQIEPWQGPLERFLRQI